MKRFARLLFAIGIFFSPQAFATCADPTGVAGEAIYNADYNMLQFCDGTSWVKMGGANDSRIGTLSGGKWCTTDGTAINCAANAPLSSFTETDPQVGTLTNNKWCKSDGSTVVCDQNSPVMVEVDPQLGVLTDGKWCRVDGSSVQCIYDGPTESDPKIGTLTNTKWCTTDGSVITCTQNAPTGADNLGNHTATTSLITKEIFSDVASASYDVWIQGNTSGTTAGDARNLALVGRTSDDVLIINYGNEYAAGTLVGGPVTVSGGTDAKLASGGFLILGSIGGDNLTINNNEIMARSGGAASALAIQYDGGATSFGGAVTVDGTITATAFSGSGASLTSLSASNLSSGTVATARLGTGTANNATFLRGDGAWAASSPVPSGLLCGMRDGACWSTTVDYTDMSLSAPAPARNMACDGQTITVTCTGSGASRVINCNNCPSGFSGVVVAKYYDSGDGVSHFTCQCATN